MAVAGFVASASARAVLAADTVATSGAHGDAPSGYTYNKWAVRMFTSGIPLILALGFIVVIVARYALRRLRERRASGGGRGTKSRLRKGVEGALLALIGIGAALAIRPFAVLAFQFLAVPIAVAGGLLAIVYFRLRRSGRERAIHRLKLVAGIGFPVGVVFGVFAFYFGVRADCDRIRASTRLRPILSACQTDLEGWVRGLGTPPRCEGDEIVFEPRTVFPSSDRSAYYLGFGYLDFTCPEPMVKVDRASHEPKHAIWMYSPWKGSCPRGSGRCVLPSFQARSLLVVDDLHDRLEEEIKLYEFMPSFLVEDTRNGTVYLPSKPAAGSWVDTSREVVFHPLEAPVRKWPVEGSLPGVECTNCDLMVAWHAGTSAVDLATSIEPRVSGGVGFVALHPEGRYLLYGDAVPRRSLLVFPLDGRKPFPLVFDWLTYFRTFGVINGAAFDPDRNEFYVTFSLGGELGVFDATTFAPKRTIPLELGVREIAFDRRRRLLYVGCYVSGDVVVYDVDHASVKERIYVGPKMRHLSLDEDLDVLLVASKAGFFEIPLAGLETRPSG